MLRFPAVRPRLIHRLSPTVAVLGLAATLLVQGCEDRPLAPPAGPLAAVFDGANGENGNPDFFFLPPLVGNPSGDPDFTTGGFHPGLAPYVRVFTLGDPLPPGCDLADAPIYAAAAPAYPAEEQYRHEWNTDGSNLTSGVHYRICVYSSREGQALGFVDVTPVDKGAKNLRTGEFVEFQDGRTLPIKFRIERGALCAQDDDCKEFRAGFAGGTFALPSQHAAVVVPEGAVKDGDELTFVVEQQLPQADGKCLPTDQPQAKGCWGLRTEPAGYELAAPVVFEACVDVSALSAEHRDAVVLHSHDADHGLVQLQAAAPATIDCTDFGALALVPQRSGLAHAWAAVRDRTVRMLGPRLLHAAGLVVSRAVAAYFPTTTPTTTTTRETIAAVLPAVQPPETPIVFHSTRDGNSEIYLLVPSTRAVTRLTNDAANDADAEFSPNGSRIAFSSTRGTGSSAPDLWIMNADGSAQTAMLTGTDWDGAPSWSPTGLRVVFARPLSATVSHIMIANADGSGGARPDWREVGGCSHGDPGRHDVAQHHPPSHRDHAARAPRSRLTVGLGAPAAGPPRARGARGARRGAAVRPP
jgi:hypothetical protein